MPTENPKVSICIPNYNYGRFIADAIQSALDQTYKNFELVIVDNCSTDDSEEVMKLPTAELWGISCLRLLRVALTIACPNRSRAAGYSY